MGINRLNLSTLLLYKYTTMELIFSMFFLLVVLFLSTLLFFFNRSKRESCRSSLKLPPGQWGWPIIGESLEYLNSGLRGVPEKFVQERMKKFSTAIFKTSLLMEPTAVVCGPGGNKLLFANEDKLVTTWFPSTINKIFPTTAVSTGSEEGKIVRKMFEGVINPGTLQMYAAKMDFIAKQHFKIYWDNNTDVKVSPLAKMYTITVACKLFVNVDDPVQVAKFSRLFTILAAGFVSMPIDLPGTPLNKAIKAANDIRNDLYEIIRQRKVDLAENKESVPQDILTHILLQNGEYAPLYVADKLLGLLMGGYNTVTSVITFIVKYLAELPHIYDEVLNEQMEILKTKKEGELLNREDIQKMRYSWNVACEVMRLTPPFQGAFREALTDFSYAGFSIPKGWKLYWSTYSTHINANYFPNPKTFDPSRFEGIGPAPYTYVPFGGGPRMCPGKDYSRLVILVFMHNIITKFKWNAVLSDEKIIVDPVPMPAKGFPIQLQPQCP
uniref:Cytochrome P450 CYP716A111 n=1 Tax=Aquilegia coerulea TaxID=218851 RepID=A0A1L3HEE9_AQUCA|nr:cytochrome P450 CYP716A111 [Aquilegia coerulea]